MLSVTPEKATISWEQIADNGGDNSYKVSRSTFPDTGYSYVNYPGTPRIDKYVDTNILPAATYYYKIQAYNGVTHDSNFSNYITVRTPDVPIKSTSGVPLFNQTDYNVDMVPGVNFKVYGCATTCLAMVYKYYGVNVDPLSLNNWLKANGGYITTEPAAGSISDWDVVNNYLGSGINLFQNLPYPEGSYANMSIIDNALNSGLPVIIKVEINSTHLPHFIVITHKIGDTYYINDPYYGYTTLNNNATYRWYNEGHGPSAMIYRTLIYK